MKVTHTGRKAPIAYRPAAKRIEMRTANAGQHKRNPDMRPFDSLDPGTLAKWPGP